MLEGTNFLMITNLPCIHRLSWTENLSLFFLESSIFPLSASESLLSSCPRYSHGLLCQNAYLLTPLVPALPWVSRPLGPEVDEGRSSTTKTRFSVWTRGWEEEVAVTMWALFFISVLQASKPNSSLFNKENGDMLREANICHSSAVGLQLSLLFLSSEWLGTAISFSAPSSGLKLPWEGS